MRIYIVLIILTSGYSHKWGRLRRQLAPSQNVQVNALESTVLFGGTTYVQSGENRIDFKEKFLNGSIWSDSSRLNLNIKEAFSNISAENAELVLNTADGSLAHSQGQNGETFLRTNRATKHSILNHVVQEAANLSFDDGTMKVQGINGKRIEMNLLTWDREMAKTITLEAETVSGGNRLLVINAVGKAYHATIRFEGALVYFIFAGRYIRLDPSFKFIDIFTEKFTVNVKTKNAPFELSFGDNDLLIVLPAEQTKVRVHKDGVNVNSRQLTKSGGKVIVGKEPLSANSVMITAKKMNLDMSNEGAVNSETNNSLIVVESDVGLIAARQSLKMGEGVPHIVVDPGTSQVEINSTKGDFDIADLLGPFKPRKDKFVDIGPFAEGTTSTRPPESTIGAAAIESTVSHAPVLSSSTSAVQGMPPPPEEASLPPSLAADVLQRTTFLTSTSMGLTESARSETSTAEAAQMNQETTTEPDYDLHKDRTVGDHENELEEASTKITMAADLPVLSKDTSTEFTSSLGTTSAENVAESTTVIPESNATSATPASGARGGDVETKTVIEDEKNLTETLISRLKLEKMPLPTIDPLLFKFMAADVPQSRRIPNTEETTAIATSPTSTTSEPTSTTTENGSTLAVQASDVLSTGSEVHLTTTTSTTATIPMFTTTISPLEELKKLKAEMEKIKKFREWEEQEVSQGGDGDEHVEEFTFPNGTTVHRLIKTSRKITTTVTHHRKEEINDTETSPQQKNERVVLGTLENVTGSSSEALRSKDGN